MGQQLINNGETGLAVRNKLNENFTELYTGKDSVTVATFADLPDPTTVPNQKYWVLTSTGVFLVNRKSRGSYYSDGAAWIWLGDLPTTADQVGNVPAGPIAATNVQAAIDELASEKQAYDANIPAFPASLTTAQLGYLVGVTSGLQAQLNAKATPADISTAISNLINSAPGALDTLDELAAALGDDANFAATMTTALAGKLAASAYTAADVLAKLLGVDGAGSGLDADLLDGNSSAYYATKGKVLLDSKDTSSGNLVTFSGFSLAYSAIWFEVLGISFDTTANFNVAVSPDNSAWSGNVGLQAASAASDGLYGLLQIPNYTGKGGNMAYRISNIAANNSLVAAAMNNITWREDSGGIQAVRFGPSTGNYDGAGSVINLYGIA